jgi:calnexin
LGAYHLSATYLGHKEAIQGIESTSELKNLNWQPHNFGENAPLFVEQFTGHHKWLSSEAKKVVIDLHGDGAQHEYKYNGAWRIGEPAAYPGLEGDAGLTLISPASHYAISTPIKPILFDGKEPFILQYEVKAQEGLECGGAYLKLFRAPLDASSSIFRPERVDDQTPYSIMFGPDRCGTTDKVLTIQRLLNSLSRSISSFSI